MKKSKNDFHNILEFDKEMRKNVGGGGNQNSYFHSIERHLQSP